MVFVHRLSHFDMMYILKFKFEYLKQHVRNLTNIFQYN